MMRYPVFTLMLSAAAFGFAHAAEAQVQLRSAPNPTIPTLGESRQDPAAAQEALAAQDAFRSFVSEAHPAWAQFTWAQAVPNLEVLNITGFPGAAAGASPVTPDFMATDVGVTFRFKNSKLTARRAYLLERYIILRDMSLVNDSGQMEAGYAVLSKDALTVIGQYVQNQRPDPDGRELAGEVVFNQAIAASHEFAGVRSGSGFSSTFAADLLGLSGIAWGEGEDASLLISGLVGAGITGEARFGGSAGFSLAKVNFSGSIPEIRTAFMERMERGATAMPGAVETDAPPEAGLQEGVEQGVGSGNEPASALDVEPGAERDGEEGTTALPTPAPAPITHPFDLTFSDFSYSATRGGDAPATIAARGGALRGVIEENGAMQVTARLADLRATANNFAGTPLEEATQQIAERAAQPHLGFDLALDAALTSDRLRLNLPCVTLPGLIDISTDIDVTIPGLEQMLTASRGGLGGGVMDLLFASQASALGIRVVDSGLNTMLSAAGLAPLGELIQSTLLSRLQGQEGMRMMMLQTALAPVNSILDQYDEQGSVTLEARFNEETNLPVALVSFLQSAKPVESTTPDMSRCEAVPLVQ